MEELVKEAIDGNKEAFVKLIESLKMDMYKIAKSRLKDEDDILDAVQETIISSYKSIKQLNKIENFKKWIIKILINKCNDIYKQRKNKIVSFEELSSNSLLIADKDFSKIEIEDILKFLSEEEKVIITLYCLEDYKSKEIAWILNMNENTVKTKIARAKKKIKNKLVGGNY